MPRRTNSSSNNQQAEDEALALALQMQFEREQQQQRNAAVSPNSSLISDEEIARRVHAQELARATSQSRGRSRSTSRTRNISASPARRPPSVTRVSRLPPASSSNQQAPHLPPPAIQRVNSLPVTSGSAHANARGRSHSRTRSSSQQPPLARSRSTSRACSSSRTRLVSSDEAYARNLAAQEERGLRRTPSNGSMSSPYRLTQTVSSPPMVTAIPQTNNANVSGGYAFPPPENTSAPTRAAFVRAQSSISDAPPPSTFLDEGDSAPPSTLEDAELARRIEQEMRDEMVAERLQQREQRRLQQSQQQQSSVATGEAVRLTRLPQNRRRKRVCGALVTISLVIGAVVGLVYYFVVLGGGVPSNILTNDEQKRTDPFDIINPEEAHRWRNSGQGVELVILNALETKWYQYFYNAVDDWDDGHPDTLTLTTEFREYDRDCLKVSGRVKVCNGNYGRTEWKGINVVNIDQDGFIVDSASRMNEYYMPERDDAQWQYTMCHEIGHAFGLGHTDEIFGNADLGDCMDYTNTPENNMKPTLRNFDFLFQLYGIVPGGEPYTSPTSAPTQSNGGGGFGDDDDDDSQVEQQQNAGGGNRRRVAKLAVAAPAPSPSLRQAPPAKKSTDKKKKDSRIRHYPYQVTEDKFYSTELQQAMDDLLHYETGQLLQPHKWQLLHKHSHGEAHEVTLPNGHRMQVHYLMA